MRWTPGGGAGIESGKWGQESNSDRKRKGRGISNGSAHFHWDFVAFKRLSSLHQILLHAVILDDELLPLGRVFAHEEGDQFVAAGEVVEADQVEADVLADEVLELAGGDFAEALEA